MTSPSPTSVTYEYEADYWTGAEWAPLPVTRITPSADADRVPYASATLTLTSIDEDTFTALDPRTLQGTGQVRWRIRQLDLAGNILGHLPRVGSSIDYAVMHVRTLTRTLTAVTLDLSGGESLLDDKLCLLQVDGPSPNATNRLLLNWILELVTTRSRPANIPERVIAADDHAAEILDRGYGWGNPGNALIRHGETYLRAVETELNSYDVRLVDAWGLGWYAATRGLPPTYDDAPTVVKLGSYTTDTTHTLPDDVDPIITDLEQTVSRDGQWADVIVLDGQTTDGLYVSKWQQTAGLGSYNLNGYTIPTDAAAIIDAHTRGRIISVDRGTPTGNLAESIASRALTRGHGITVTARARFDVLPGMDLQVHLRDTNEILGTILAVEWNLDEGTMTIRAQAATTTPPVVSTQDGQTEPTAAQNIAAQTQALADRITPEVERFGKWLDYNTGVGPRMRFRAEFAARP